MPNVIIRRGTILVFKGVKLFTLSLIVKKRVHLFHRSVECANLRGDFKCFRNSHESLHAYGEAVIVHVKNKVLALKI